MLATLKKHSFVQKTETIISVSYIKAFAMCVPISVHEKNSIWIWQVHHTGLLKAHLNVFSWRSVCQLQVSQVLKKVQSGQLSVETVLCSVIC